jgi:hypothetical protein
MSNERGRFNLFVWSPAPQRVELLQQGHRRMDAADTSRAIFVEVAELTEFRELIVNERRLRTKGTIEWRRRGSRKTGL